MDISKENIIQGSRRKQATPNWVEINSDEEKSESKKQTTLEMVITNKQKTLQNELIICFQLL